MIQQFKKSSGKVNFNFFQIFLGIALVMGVYASSVYMPVIKKRSTLLEILGEASFKAKRQKPDLVKKAIISAAKRKVNVDLYPDNIKVDKQEGFVIVKLKWQPIVDWGFGHRRMLTFNMEKERATY